MKALGKLMQIAALILLPLAMVMELTNFLGREVGVADMVIMLIFGTAIFYVGRIVEGYGR